MGNKIINIREEGSEEEPKTIYWISTKEGEYVGYGVTEDGQITEGNYEFIEYESASEWKSRLGLFGVDPDAEENE